MMKDIDKVKKRQYQFRYSGNENLFQFDQAQLIPQSSFEIKSYCSSASSSTHELGYAEEVFTWLENEKSKTMFDMPRLEDYSDVFCLNPLPDFGLFTPTVAEVEFFA